LSVEQSADLSELAIRLTAFGRRTFADFGLGADDTTVAGVGLSVDDFVWKVLEEYVVGKLEHEPSRGELFAFLATAMRNDIIDSLRKAAHAREKTRSPLPRDRARQEDPPGLDELPSNLPHFVALLHEEEYRKRLSAALAGEPELMEIVGVILDQNLYKPREIAAALGITATEVQNRKKRLRRRFIECNLAKALFCWT